MIFPARTNNFNVDSLRGQAIAKQLRDTTAEVQEQMGKRMFEIALRLVLILSFSGFPDPVLPVGKCQLQMICLSLTILSS